MAQGEILLRQKDDEIEHQEVLGRESDQRLLNGLQMISSLLSLQSRTSANPEAAAQLKVAANRVGMIQRVHQRLHSFEGIQTVAFKEYPEKLCSDFCSMISTEDAERQHITVEGAEIQLPTVSAIPLSFIVSEPLTNATKYGKGIITVRLAPNNEIGYTLSVSNGGPSLPDDFDPAASRGLGMKIIRSFVERLGAELRVDRGDKNQGARFTVLVS